MHLQRTSIVTVLFIGFRLGTVSLKHMLRSASERKENKRQVNRWQMSRSSSFTPGLGTLDTKEQNFTDEWKTMGRRSGCVKIPHLYIWKGNFARLITRHACYLMGPLCTYTPFQCCRFGKPPNLLPENKMADGCHKKSCKQRKKLDSKKRRNILRWA